MSAKDFDENSPNNLLSSKIRQTMKSSVQQALEYSGKYNTYVVDGKMHKKFIELV